MEQRRDDWTRRSFLWRLIAIPPAVVLAACSGRSLNDILTGFESPTSDSTAIMQTLPPTPACGDDDDDLTIAQTEGPYYTPGTPERTSLLETGITGTRLLLLFARRLRLGQSPQHQRWYEPCSCHLPLSLDKPCFLPFH